PSTAVPGLRNSCGSEIGVIVNLPSGCKNPKAILTTVGGNSSFDIDPATGSFSLPNQIPDGTYTLSLACNPYSLGNYTIPCSGPPPDMSLPPDLSMQPDLSMTMMSNDDLSMQPDMTTLALNVRGLIAINIDETPSPTPTPTPGPNPG